MMKAEKAARFGGFAAAHVLWSLVCSAFFLRLLDADPGVLWLSAAVGMLGYLLLGWATARIFRWPAPSTKARGAFAVALPAGIAWLWAGTTAFCLYGSGDTVMAAAALGLPAFFLAAPSLNLIWAWMETVGRALSAGDPQSWLAAAIFLAGLLPPLLFFLGSLLGIKKTEAA